MQKLSADSTIAPSIPSPEFHQQTLFELSIPRSPKLDSHAIVVWGVGTGDEGKGRVIHEVNSELEVRPDWNGRAKTVVKVNGGANSGHTVAGEKLNLLPAGVVDKGVETLAIGAGVVADPRKFAWEAALLESKGFPVISRLLIDRRTMVSDVTHRLLDLAFEDLRSRTEGSGRGSTGRGISPAYADEVQQFQIRYGSFLNSRDDFAAKMKDRVDRCVKLIQGVCELSKVDIHGFLERLTQAELRANENSISRRILPESEFDFRQFASSNGGVLDVDRIVQVYWDSGRSLARQIGDVSGHIHRLLSYDQNVLFEMGQGFLLDKREGYPPNVTASHTLPHEVFASVGLPVVPLHEIAVFKAYETKVGVHHFPTQIDEVHPLYGVLSPLEFGTSTGRQRMVGWLDTVALGEAIRKGGASEVVINKIDALTYQGNWKGPLKVCTGYLSEDGKHVFRLPADEHEWRRLTPQYRQFDGWSEDLSNIRHFSDLPLAAQEYVAGVYYHVMANAFDGIRIEVTDLPPVKFVGVGADPDQVIRDVASPEELIRLGRPGR